MVPLPAGEKPAGQMPPAIDDRGRTRRELPMPPPRSRRAGCPVPPFRRRLRPCPAPALPGAAPIVSIPRFRSLLVAVAWLAAASGAAAAESAGDTLVVAPAAVHIGSPEATCQVVLLESGGDHPGDRTRAAAWRSLDPAVATVDPTGLVSPRGEGTTWIEATIGGRSARAGVTVSGLAAPAPVSFTRDVQAILTKHACNSGGCHGKAEGQNGFKLSLLGFDDAADHAAIVAGSHGRRVNPAAPQQSLLVRKATAAEPHGGGAKIEPASAAERVLARWVAEGARPGGADDAGPIAIAVEPESLTLAPQADSQIRVVAIAADGSRRCVTRGSDFFSSVPSIAAVGPTGLVEAGTIPGDAAILVRHLGHVATVRVVVPRPGARFVRPPEFGEIDRLVHDRLAALGIPSADLCDDATFLRRAFLDTIGTLPTPDEVRAFLADGDPGKRDRLVAGLLVREEYADYWTMRWADILRADKSKIGPQGAVALSRWLRRQLASNRPYDEFVREILTAEGAIGAEGPAAVFKALDGPEVAARSLSQLFLGVRIECAQCHHHPSERWSQDDYAALAGFFTGVKVKALPGGGESIVSRGGGEVAHPRTGLPVPAAPLGAPPAVFPAGATDRRRTLADWATSPDNPFLARSIANRLWAHYFGRGLVEPIDDLRATNPATNEPLLDHLAGRVVALGWDLRAFTRELLASRAYQLSATPAPGAEQDRRHVSHALPRALPAEVLLDAVCTATGVAEKFNGWPGGIRAVQVWDNRLPSYFFKIFGRPVRATVCECERGTEPSIAQALHLINSPEIQEKIAARTGTARRLAESSLAPGEIVEELCLGTLSRPPTAGELARLLPLFDGAADPSAAELARQAADVRRAATEDVLWTFLNSAEFLGNH